LNCGIAVDRCTGNIFISDEAQGAILEYDKFGGEVGHVGVGLLNPGQLLGLNRSGVSCPYSFQLLVVERGADRISLVVPDDGAVSPWLDSPDSRDVSYLPPGSPFPVNAGVLVTEQSGSTGQVVEVETLEIYESEAVNPPPAELLQFADPNLEAVVRDSLGLGPTEPITRDAAAALTILSASGKGIQSIRGLEGMTGLTVIDFAGNNIADVSPLAGLKDVWRLNLLQNNISDIGPIAGLTKLTMLWIYRNDIDDIKPLANLTDLTLLSAGQNSIDDVSPLTGLTQLTKLWIADNKIGDILPLSGLTKLTDLGLSSNDINDLSPLAGLTQLSWLNLSQNNVSDLSPLAGLTQLTQLFLEQNGINDITPLAGLTQLTQLYLNSNNISDLTPLAGLTQLSDLLLDDNSITDLARLVSNAGLGSGDWISLHTNPLDAADCPDLQTLIDRGAAVTHDVTCP
jgi:Leucine-rich repeat (LRR) protein